MALNTKFTFDDKTYRHFLNGEAMVLHCHHYMSLYTQLAETCKEYGGPRILKEAAEDSLFPFLKK